MRMADIPIVHGSAAVVMNATDVVSFVFDATATSATQASIVRSLHSWG
jgi:hypothetical protein